MTAIDRLERRAAVLARRADLQRAAIRRRAIARLTTPETLATAVACGALVGLGMPRVAHPRHARRRQGGGLLRAFALVNRYSGPWLSLIAWLVPAFALQRPRTSTP